MKLRASWVLVVLCVVVFVNACNAAEIVLPIDTEQEAIAIAKQDKEVQNFIQEWSKEFKINFEAQFLSDKKAWLVRIYPKGNIKDVEIHVIINTDGEIIDKYNTFI